MNVAQTMVEKIFSRHAGKNVKLGDIVDIAIDVRAARDFGGANVVKNLKDYNLTIENPSQTIFTFDCNPTGSDQKYASNQHVCRQYAREHDISLYDIDSGIGTHLVIDNGLVGPGDTFVSTDSHANILGAIGAFGQGMGDVDIAYTFACGKVWFKVPPSLKINIKGKLPSHCTAKDLTLALLRRFGANGLLGYAAELGGEAIEQLDLAGRITLSSMATEMGAIILLIPPSEIIIKQCKYFGAQFNELYADKEAPYESVIDMDISGLTPLISRPGKPHDVVAVQKVEGTAIDSVFIGSCTNGRYEDIALAADILKHAKKADHIVLKVVPSTDGVWKRCMKNGIFDILKNAGALISNAGCAGCAAGQVGQNGPGEITLSTGNRNFVGKQGKGEVYLCSPATAAASAIAGFIVSADRLGKGHYENKIKIKSDHAATHKIKREPKKSSILQGRIWIIPQDNIDTDQIYHNRYLAITDKIEMGQYTFDNLPGWQNFAKKCQPGDILIAGKNFGCGSSRQQAVDCFKSLGLQLIIAQSFGAIYERNAINSAFPVLTVDLLKEEIADGQIVKVDLLTGTLELENGRVFRCTPFSDIQMSIYLKGGLL